MQFSRLETINRLPSPIQFLEKKQTALNPKFLKENTEIKQLARGWTKDWGFRGLQEEDEGNKGKPLKRNS